MEYSYNRKKQILEDCIYNNYIQYIQKNRNPIAAMEQTQHALRLLLRNHDFNGFTRSYNIRCYLKEQFANSKDYADMIIDKFVDELINHPNMSHEQMPLYNAIMSTYSNYGKKQVMKALHDVIGENPSYNSFSRYTNNNNVNYRVQLMNSLSSDDIFSIIINTVMKSVIQEKDIALMEDTKSINDSINNAFSDRISNFKVNPLAVNLCRQDIFNGIQTSFKRAHYSIGNLYASIDIGNKRQKQEDSVVIVTHPNNPDFKMLVISDGAGGSLNGENASSFTTLSIMHWFEELHPNYFDSRNVAQLQYLFNQKISEISNSIYKKYHGKSYSTFVGAIVGENDTIISNVGDSRAYIYANGKLEQLTRDDNVAYKLWESGRIKKKDDIRFHKDSNRLTNSIGGKDYVSPSSLTLPNNSYDTLLLFSDGITDCLSDKDIKAITKHTSPAKLARSLIETAKSTSSVKRASLDPQEYKESIDAGKDNLSAAILDNTSSKKNGVLNKFFPRRSNDDDSR